GCDLHATSGSAWSRRSTACARAICWAPSWPSSSAASSSALQRRLRDTSVCVSDTEEERKQAEVEYPRAIGEEGRVWLHTKPFGNTPRQSARLLIDFGYILQLLDLHPGGNMVDLGCGPGWTTRFAARHGIRAEGYDISPDM